MFHGISACANSVASSARRLRLSNFILAFPHVLGCPDRGRRLCSRDRVIQFRARKSMQIRLKRGLLVVAGSLACVGIGALVLRRVQADPSHESGSANAAPRAAIALVKREAVSNTLSIAGEFLPTPRSPDTSARSTSISETASRPCARAKRRFSGQRTRSPGTNPDAAVSTLSTGPRPLSTGQLFRRL